MVENDIAEEMTSDDSMLTIRTDETLRELDEHGTPGFPFVYYLDDLDRYAGRREEWHWHIEFEWCVAERGEVDCLIDSDRIRLREGDGIFIGSRVIHGFESAAPAIMPNVLFPPSFLFQEGTDIYTESMLPVLNSGITSAVMRRDDAAAGGVLDALRGVYRLVRSGGGKLDLFLSCGILWREFLTFLGTAGDGKLTRRVSGHDMLTSSRMRTMLGYISENYSEKTDLSMIAASAGISKSEALRCFNESIGVTPVRYLNDYRLSRAKDLLTSTEDTVTSVAMSVGIDNISYFVRRFSEKFGMTPSAYRSRTNAARKRPPEISQKW